jgi:hypothetical protein
MEPASKDPLSVEIHTGDSESRIEQVHTVASGIHRIRFSCSRGGHPQAGSVELTEKELVTLLAQAIRAGVVSPDFIRNLKAEFEI